MDSNCTYFFGIANNAYSNFNSDRYKFKDLLVLAALALSVCIVIQVFGFEFFGNLIGGTDGILFAIMGVVALLTFSSAIIVLRKIDKGMESSNV